MTMNPYLRCGYTEREAMFLSLVEGCGGLFIRDQYNRFAGVRWGDTSARLVNKVCDNRHVKMWTTAKRTMIYQWLGLDSRPQQRPAPDIAVRQMQGLDYVVAHYQQKKFLLEDEQKVDYFRNTGVPDGLLFDRFGHDPIFVSGSLIGFCFVAGGRKFKAWLASRRSLLSSLAGAEIVYIGGEKRAIAAAKRYVSAVEKHSNDDEVDSKFAAWHAWNTGERSAFTTEKISQLKQWRAKFSSERLSHLYAQWLSGDRSMYRSKGVPNLTFSAYVYTSSYGGLFASRTAGGRSSASACGDSGLACNEGCSEAAASTEVEAEVAGR